MSKPELSVIIISYNTREITLNCLTSIVNSDIKVPYEIVVFDNASEDGSQEAIKTLADLHRQIKLVEHDENVGFGRGNNQAVKHAQGKYILLLNSDTLVLDNAVNILFNFFVQNESKLQFLGGKLFNKDKTPQASCGPFFTPGVVFGFLFMRGDYWGLTRYSPDTVKEVDWVSGACLMTKKDLFTKLGGFDEKIFMYMEEVDLLYRAKKQGMKVFFCPQARFVHLGSASSGGRTYPILQVYKGYIYFYKKHYGQAALFWLKIMLQLKARTAVFAGRTMKNRYLIDTYEEAYKLARMA